MKLWSSWRSDPHPTARDYYDCIARMFDLGIGDRVATNVFFAAPGSRSHDHLSFADGASLPSQLLYCQCNARLPRMFPVIHLKFEAAANLPVAALAFCSINRGGSYLACPLGALALAAY